MTRFIWKHVGIGCGVGGCLVPILGVIACSVLLNDIGGWLFWPLLVPVTAGLGALIGLIIGASRPEPPATFAGDTDQS